MRSLFVNVLTAAIIGLSLLCPLELRGQGITLEKETIEAFESYVSSAEARMRDRIEGRSSFLWLDENEGTREELIDGELVIERLGSKEDLKIPKGLIHDWIGAIFIPGGTCNGIIRLFQNYDGHKDIYPQVLNSRLISREGNLVRGYLRVKKKKVLTVVLDTEHEARFFELDEKHWYTQTRSTRIVQVENAGKPDEHTLPVGEDDGFLWRLNAYWRLEEVDDGVFAECRTISLSRDVPWSLGWLVKPFVTSIPRESLTNMLQVTRLQISGGMVPDGDSTTGGVDQHQSDGEH